MYHDDFIQPQTVPPAGTTEFHVWAAALGIQIANGETGRVEGQLKALVRRARELNVAAVPASVLADRRAPEVARARAFSRVVAALSALTPVRVAELGATA